MISNELRIQRLEYLREIMRGHAKADGEPLKLNGISAKFNLTFWYHLDSCETQACALGSYALSPYGKRYWKWQSDGYVEYPCLKRTRLKAPDSHSAVYHHAAIHFGLPSYLARYIFDPDTYYKSRTPDSVIERIDKVLRQTGGAK